ncbi:MAG TPA: rhodanese-like domain-containing protein [Stellaceae bacterium]|nr:rhodanese-like domain-containing protein [Stellaceae bacterium]
MLERLLRRLRRPAGGPAWLQVGELRRRLDSGQVQLIIDVRGQDEFDGPLGHIPGAINVPLAALAERTAQLAQTALPIVLVCLTDKRSSQAAAALEAAGVRQVAVLQGGMRAWRGE